MTKKSGLKTRLIIILVSGAIAIGVAQYSSFTKTGFINQFLLLYPTETPNTSTQADPFFTHLATCAERRTKEHIVYDGSYVEIDFPMGDIDQNKGVCTDVLIRSYRTTGIDLQEELHKDIKKNFIAYPKLWRKTKPDTHIDHRRVPNLMVFFKRCGTCLPITKNQSDYAPGDIVAWDLSNGLMHIGIVSTKTSPNSGNPLIVHNIGAGPRLEDVLFNYKIIGHFRYKSPDNSLSM